jgi:lauroyl/myristoyl acyltransferase
MIAEAFREVVRHSPGLAVSAAHRLGDWLYRRGSDRREDLLRNIAAAFPDADAEAVATRFARSRYELMIEQLQLDYLEPSKLRAFCESSVTWRNAEPLDAALAGEKPVIAFTPHYNHFAIATLSMILRAHGKKSVSMFFNPPEKNPYARRMRRLIDVLGVESQPLYNDRAGLLKAFRALHKGGCIGIMPDVFEQEPGTIFVPFLGRFAYAMTGTAFLALKYDATVIPLYCHRAGRGRFEIRVDEPLELRRGADLEESLWLTTAAIFENMETHLGEAPEHWMYLDRYLRRVYPGITVPSGAEEWSETLNTLSRRFWSKSPLGELVRELPDRLSA